MPEPHSPTGPAPTDAAQTDAAPTDAAPTDDRDAADPAHPAEGPADAAGPAAGTGGGPRRPTTVGTAPSIRDATSAHGADTGAAQGGTTGERDDLERPG